MSRVRRVFILLFSVIVLAISFSWLYLTVPQWFLSIDGRLRDFLFVLRGPVSTTGSLVIVDIDEKSLRRYGQWPWSRDIMAKLIENLRDYGAGIIGLDIVFAEADRTSRSFDKESNESCPDLNDKLLAKAVASSPVVGGYFFSFDFNTTDAPSIPAVFIEKGLSEERYIFEPKGVRLNIKCIQDSFYSTGFFNTMPDSGGMIRFVPLLMRYNDILYPSLALEMIRIYSGTERVVVRNSHTGVDSIQLGDAVIPTDRFARILVNYRGGAKHFKYLSAADVIDRKVNASDLEGKFVLVGTSAIGLADLRPTPMDSVVPGVEIHANIIDNILRGDIISFSHNRELLDIAIILTTVALSALLFYLVPAWLIVPLFVSTLYGMYRFFYHMFFDQGLCLNILMPLVGMLATVLVILLLRFLFVSLQEKRLKNAFAQKVSPAVMSDILKNRSSNLLEPKDKEVTIFFSDIRSFTTISETLGDPVEVINLLNEYLTPMVDSIVKHQGTIDKFIGDAIMAYWNAPIDVPNHADEAVRCALDQIGTLDKINEIIRSRNEKIYLKVVERLNEMSLDRPGSTAMISIGAGIHTGEVTIGEMGSIGRSDYTIIGDNVNLASRLEGLCKYYGVSIIISESTKRALRGDYMIRELDLVRVKGKREAVSIYQVLSDEMNGSEMELYESALSVYRKADFLAACKIFDELSHTGEPHSVKLYDLYRKRCEKLAKMDIKTFDGIYDFKTK